MEVKKETIVYLMRHGESEGNREKIFQGSTSTSQLSALGQEQSKALARRLSKVKFTAVYSSPLPRAFETAKTAFKHTGLNIHVHEDLRERNFGELEGMSRAKVERENPELMESYEKSRALPGVKGAESTEDVMERAWKILEKIVKENEGGVIGILAHGGVNGAILLKFLGIPPKNVAMLRQGNTCVNKLTFGSEHCDRKADYINDTSHLDGL